MHELSIAQSLVELVSDHAQREGSDRVKAIRIRLGELSGFQRALHFCFDRVAAGTVCEDARLELETVPLTMHCDACDAVKPPSFLHNFRCRDCGMPMTKLITGREMQVTAVELSFPPAGKPAAIHETESGNRVPAE